MKQVIIIALVLAGIAAGMYAYCEYDLRHGEKGDGDEDE